MWRRGKADLVVRIAGGVSCGFVLIHDERPLRPLLRGLQWPFIGVAATMLVLWLALAGPVRRLRRLAEEVERSAASHYREGIAGDLAKGGPADEIASVGRAFNHATQQVQQHITTIEARERTLREFLANTTHDVMLPLTVLQGALVSLEASMGTSADPASASELQLARQEAHYLGALLSNLSAAAKLDAGAPHIHRGEISLCALVERSVERQRAMANERQLELNLALPTSDLLVSADPTLVEQAFSNLVYNAVRYNQSGGHIAVLLEAPASGGFVLRVIDDGPGMNEAERTRALERGFRGTLGQLQRPNGSGLGLAIAHEVASIHGWLLTLHASSYGGLEARVSGPTVAHQPTTT